MRHCQRHPPFPTTVTHRPTMQPVHMPTHHQLACGACCCAQVLTTLEELAAVVRGWGHRQCAPGVVLDLDGRTLGGSLPGGVLVLGVPGLVLRNGSLVLPEGAHVVVAAKDVRLELVTFTGKGPEGGELSDDYAKVAGLVVVEGAGRSAVLER